MLRADPKPHLRKLGLIVRVAALSVAACLCSGAALAETPFSLGLYVGNADASNPAAMARFKAAFDAHNAALGGEKPKFFNIFTDNRSDPSTWASSAGFAVRSATLSGSAYVAASSGIIPDVGVPLAWPGLGNANVADFYRNTISGAYDSAWKGIVDAWAGGGYKTVDFRIGYEMNGSFMVWSPNNSRDPAANQLFVDAFRHVADILHSEGTAQGIDAVVHWNPTAINFTNYAVTSLYPGDSYVDVIGTDQYSTIYPLDLTDWRTPAHTQMANVAAWAAVPENRAHYFLYPNATQYLPTPALDSKGWSLAQAIEFADLHDKPIAIDETGVGPSGSSVGLADDPEFPRYLAALLAQAEAQGVTVRNVNIWDTTLSDGDWNFINGSKPLTAEAWREYFGTIAVAGIPEPLTWTMFIIGFGIIGAMQRAGYREVLRRARQNRDMA